MNKEIKIDVETKEKIINNLEIVECTIGEVMSEIGLISTNINQIVNNPEVYNIISNLEGVNELVSRYKDNIEDLKVKADNNLEELFKVDEEISTKYGEGKNA